MSHSESHDSSAKSCWVQTGLNVYGNKLKVTIQERRNHDRCQIQGLDRLFGPYLQPAIQNSELFGRDLILELNAHALTGANVPDCSLNFATLIPLCELDADRGARMERLPSVHVTACPG